MKKTFSHLLKSWVTSLAGIVIMGFATYNLVVYMKTNTTTQLITYGAMILLAAGFIRMKDSFFADTFKKVTNKKLGE